MPRMPGMPPTNYLVRRLRTERTTHIVPLPQELAETLNWEPGDHLEIVAHPNHTITVRSLDREHRTNRSPSNPA